MTSGPLIADLIAQRMHELRPGQKRIARVLLADYPSAGLRTVAAIASESGVSAPSVVRFANALGFDGFRSLQAALREEISALGVSPLSRGPWRPEPGSAAEALVRRARVLADSAVDSLAAIAPSEIEAAIDLLADTSRPLLASGGRFSRILAQHLVANLEQLRAGVRYLAEPFGRDLAELVDLGPRHVVLVMDFHRYQDSSIRLAETARSRGAAVVVITDERLSPATAFADVVLSITADAPVPFYSFGAGVLLAELLVVPVYQRLGGAASHRMAQWDALRGQEFARDRPAAAKARRTR